MAISVSIHKPRSVNAQILKPKRVDVSVARMRKIHVAFPYARIQVSDANAYMGPYDVVPTADGLTLETARKLMTQDVDIRPIPIYEVSNTSGGTTVYIAATVDD